jgi:hypothetical protein
MVGMALARSWGVDADCSGVAVDPDEKIFKQQELSWREREFGQREDLQAKQSRLARRTSLITAGSVLVSAAALVTTVVMQERQSRRTAEQTRLNLQRDEYTQIVAGLSSTSVAVQDSSMRRLVAYVQNPANYPSSEARSEGVANAIHTLTAFIIDESIRSRRRAGLNHYQNPQPVIVPRAMQRLKDLTSDPAGAVVVDIGGADLHGATIRDWRPNAHVVASGADFRRASLSGLDLTAEQVPSSLNSAFFTCANLADAKLGTANLAGADLTGADLTGANLSEVTGLDPEQLSGATITSTTWLPSDLSVLRSPGWGTTSDRCRTIVNDMTGMRGAQGYTDRLPCPTTPEEVGDLDIEPAWRGEPEDLANVCRLRERSRPADP